MFFHLLLTNCFGSPFYTFYCRLRPLPVNLAMPPLPSPLPSTTLLRFSKIFMFPDTQYHLDGHVLNPLTWPRPTRNIESEDPHSSSSRLRATASSRSLQPLRSLSPHTFALPSGWIANPSQNSDHPRTYHVN